MIDALTIEHIEFLRGLAESSLQSKSAHSEPFSKSTDKDLESYYEKNKKLFEPEVTINGLETVVKEKEKIRIEPKEVRLAKECIEYFENKVVKTYRFDIVSAKSNVLS